MNIDEEPGIASRYDVLSIPTVILFAGGEPHGAVVGLAPAEVLRQWLAEVLPAGELVRLPAERERDTLPSSQRPITANPSGSGVAANSS